MGVIKAKAQGNKYLQLSEYRKISERCDTALTKEIIKAVSRPEHESETLKILQIKWPFFSHNEVFVCFSKC